MEEVTFYKPTEGILMNAFAHLLPFSLVIGLCASYMVNNYERAPERRPASVTEVAEYAGLSENESYPALIEGFDTLDGNIEGTHVLGTGTVSNSEPVRTIALSVSFDGIIYYDLLLLADNVEFKRIETAREASIRFSLTDRNNHDLAEWHDGVFTPSPKLDALPEKDILEMFFEHAVITLPPEEHERIYGK